MFSKFSLISLSLSAAVLAAPEPQMDMAAMMASGKLEPLVKMMPVLALSKTVSMPPVSKKEGVVREQLYFGPLVLKPVAEKLKEKPGPGQMDPQSNAFNLQASKIPRDITLLRTSTNVRDIDGNVLGISQGVYNHHITVQDLSQPAAALLSCPNKKNADLPSSSIAGVGEDGGSKLFTIETSSELTGYHIGAKDTIMFASEIVNNSNATRNVYTVIDMEYVKAKPAVPSTWHVVSVGMCDGKGLEVRPEAGKQKFALTSQPMTMLKDGIIFGLRGHLHDGGVTVLIKNNGALICDSKAKYGGTNKVSGSWETISEMAECGDVENIVVKKGDNITIETSYDFDLHPARKHGDGMMAEAMGLALFTFAEGKPSK